jgi:hypothetical protein
MAAEDMTKAVAWNGSTPQVLVGLRDVPYMKIINMLLVIPLIS